MVLEKVLIDPLIMLQVHESIELQLALDALDLLGISLENVVHVVAGLEMASVVSELAAAKLFDLIKLRTFRLHFLGDSPDDVRRKPRKGAGFVPVVFTTESG